MPSYRTLVALLALAPAAALAQGAGFAGRPVGTGVSGVPSNPFASNYPLAPPPRALVERRERRAVHRSPRDSGLVPPGSVPR